MELGANVVLGPDVYDFNKNRKYHILVLLEDGSIQMFNLKGEKPAKWKGIAVPGETISGLPSESTTNGKTIWTVPFFSGNTAKFTFYGDPVEAQ